MSWSMATWAKLIVVATIAFATLFLAPAVDAATCVAEPPAVHGGIAHDQNNGDHNTKSSEHGICSHGHCHHTSTARPNGLEAIVPTFGEPPLQGGLQDDFLDSIAPDGLKRPPRD